MMGKLTVCFLICLVELSLHVVSCHGSRHLLEIYTPAHINGSTDSYSSNEVNIESQCTETTNAYVFTLKVPGFNKEDVKVESETGILRIMGENKKCEKELDEVHWSYDTFGSSMCLQMMLRLMTFIPISPMVFSQLQLESDIIKYE